MIVGPTWEGDSSQNRRVQHLAGRPEEANVDCTWQQSQLAEAARPAGPQKEEDVRLAVGPAAELGLQCGLGGLHAGEHPRHYQYRKLLVSSLYGCLPERLLYLEMYSPDLTLYRCVGFRSERGKRAAEGVDEELQHGPDGGSVRRHGRYDGRHGRDQ